MTDNDFFIGWAAKPPKPDRRFFMGAGLTLLAGTGGLGFALARHQNAVGPGTWDQGAVREWRGIATAEPYALFRTKDLDGTPRTALLSCLGKCGVAARIGTLSGQPVVIKGSLIERGAHAMIAVSDGMDWIQADPAAETPDSELAFPPIEPLSSMTISGEIVDSKCWFGAMRPSEGKVHKSCAALCIRGGLPPALLVKDRKNQQALMILTDRGMAHGDALLPLVADPVEITAQLFQSGNLLFLDAPVSAIRRLG
ncbi:MAG: hypothetical protein AAGK23_05330 [Pseudomonadota bacterium]